MRTNRMEAFSDGVLAIIITIMVLELPKPTGDGWHSLRSAVPTLLSYALSFAYIGVYWISHHHLIAATSRVTSAVLWANLDLLFWLSLVPWTTSWLGMSHFAQVPTIVYGVSLLLPGFAYQLLQTLIVRDQGEGSVVATSAGVGWKGKWSLVFYAAGVVLAVLDIVPASMALFGAVAVMWIVPDRALEARVEQLDSERETT